MTYGQGSSQGTLQAQSWHVEGRGGRNRPSFQGPVSEDQPRGDEETLQREVEYHPAVKKDLKRLDPQIARAAFGTIESLANGQRHSSTHPLNGPLKGWEATDVRGNKDHRITYRSVPGGPMLIGHIGPHNYDQAVQRLADIDYNYRQETLDPVKISDKLHLAIQDFRKEHYHKFLTQKDTWGPCTSVSNAFVNHLNERGISAKRVRLKNDPDRESYHDVVESGGHHIDWTARQFSDDEGSTGSGDDFRSKRIPVPVVYSKDRFGHPYGGGYKLEKNSVNIREAMAWTDHAGMDEHVAQAKPVKAAGFKGFVDASEDHWGEEEDHHNNGFDEDLWDKHAPEPTEHEQAHFEKHDEYPDSYHQRHEKAYFHGVEQKRKENVPDIEDDHLHHFINEHGSDSKLWRLKGKLGNVDISKGVYATQSHVGQTHINRYLQNPKDQAWHTQLYGDSGQDYLAHKRPMFVTHQGRLHVTDGHHRVAAGIQRGDKKMQGYHFNLDEHPIAPDEYNGGNCETCEFYHNNRDADHHLGARRFIPTQRVFTHTCGLDHRLFDGEKLRPEVRRYILKTLGAFWLPLYGAGWDNWSMVYFAGSEASEWTSETLEGNNDFDVLVGVDYTHFRDSHEEYRTWSNEEITTQFNEQFRNLNNKNTWITVDGTPYGPFDNTWYVNQNSYDIKNIKPYAAYNVSEDRWAVKPPHLPHWSLSDLPRAVQRVLKACDTLANDVLKLPEPERTQQGAALFDAWHSDRSRAFSQNGEGWYDIANLREKWLDQEGIWAEIVNCKHRFNEGFGAANTEWSNIPNGYVAKIAVHIDDYKHDPDREWYHGSPNKFPEFGDLHGSQSGDWNTSLGHHFTSEPEIAKGFGKHQYRVKLPMQNPKIYHSEEEMDNEVMHHEHNQGNHYTNHLNPSFKQLTTGNGRSGWAADEALRRGDLDIAEDNSHHWLSKHPDRKGIIQRYRSRLQEAGHDGIVYGNDWEGPGHASAIAFPGKPIVPIKNPKGYNPHLGSVETLYGSNDVNKLFTGDGPTTSSPWPQAGRLKDRKDYDSQLVGRSITHPHEFPVEDVDPRGLRSTQPSITLGGVNHYLNDKNDKTFGEQNGDRRLGNDVPRIYHREDGQQLILSGHHRAAASLLKGEPLKAIVIHGPWGQKR